MRLSKLSAWGPSAICTGTGGIIIKIEKFDMDSELKMFEKFKLSDEEVSFLDNVLASRNHDFNERILPAYQIVSEMYLSKQIEAASKSSDRSARALSWLTALIALSTLSQALIAYLTLSNK